MRKLSKWNFADSWHGQAKVEPAPHGESNTPPRMIYNGCHGVTLRQHSHDWLEHRWERPDHQSSRGRGARRYPLQVCAWQRCLYIYTL